MRGFIFFKIPNQVGFRIGKLETIFRYLCRDSVLCFLEDSVSFEMVGESNGDDVVVVSVETLCYRKIYTFGNIIDDISPGKKPF